MLITILIFVKMLRLQNKKLVKITQELAILKLQIEKSRGELRSSEYYGMQNKK